MAASVALPRSTLSPRPALTSCAKRSPTRCRARAGTTTRTGRSATSVPGRPRPWMATRSSWSGRTRATAASEDWRMAVSAVKRVEIIVQENHTTDNYFRGLAPYGVNVATGWPTSPNPPAADHPHDRHAYFNWLIGKSKTVQHVQFDTVTALPFYAFLALT